MGRRRRRARLLTGTVALALGFVPAAAGQTPGELSGVDQYVEQLPTGEGNRPAGSLETPGGASATAGEEARAVVLDAGVERELARRGGSDARALRSVAGSPAYGAPTARLRLRRPRAPDEGEGTVGGALSSAVGSLADGEGGAGGTKLVVVLAASTLAGVLLALGRLRRRGG